MRRHAPVTREDQLFSMALKDREKQNVTNPMYNMYDDADAIFASHDQLLIEFADVPQERKRKCRRSRKQCVAVV